MTEAAIVKTIGRASYCANKYRPHGSPRGYYHRAGDPVLLLAKNNRGRSRHCLLKLRAQSSTTHLMVLPPENDSLDIDGAWLLPSKQQRGDVCRHLKIKARSKSSNRHFAPQLLCDRLFAIVNADETIATRRLKDPDIANHPLQAGNFQRRCLIGAPHGTIQCNVALD